jgi:hypothetical protein
MNDPIREVDPSFANQAQAQRGGTPTAPSCNPSVPTHHAPVPLPAAIERIAEIAAPGSATSNALTYHWRE